MICPNCGGDLKPGARFCTKCGTSIAAAPPVKQAAPPTGPQFVAPKPIEEYKRGPKMPGPRAAPRYDGPPPTGRKPNRNAPPMKFVGCAVILMIVGVLLILLAGDDFSVPLSGEYTSGGKPVFSLTFPKSGWFGSSSGRYSGSDDSSGTVARFCRGKNKPCAVELQVIYESIGADAQKIMDSDVRARVEPLIIKRMEEIASENDATYKHLKLSDYQVGGKPGFWVEGNLYRDKETFRTFVFVVFGETFAYDLWFIFKENDTDKYWEEIKQMVDGFSY